MIITQPDRVLLADEVGRHAHRLRGKVLDVGSGRSRRYERLFTNATAYLTLDVDPAGKPDLVGSAEAIPLPDASVDGVLCTQVLEHVPHPWVAVREMYRVLRPGGCLLLTAPQTNELHEEPRDFFRYTSHGLKVLLEDAGFRIDRMEQRGRYHATLMQIRIRHLVNTWRPYERPWAMWVLGPLTRVLTAWALWRDRRSASPAALHAIGWCVLAHKP
jgi:SAM-dependent methyltransferase